MLCDFCAKKTIDNQELFKNENFRVLFPRSPVIKRHFLLVPIRHIQFSHNLNLKELEDLFLIQKNIYETLKTKEGCIGYNLYTNNREKEGDQQMHCHFHMFGRFIDEEESPIVLLGKGKSQKLTNKMLENTVSRFRSLFKNK